MTYQWDFKQCYKHTLAVSISGIGREILKTKRKLWKLRQWYRDPLRTTERHNILGFYTLGIKALKDLRKLEIIRGEMMKLKSELF